MKVKFINIPNDVKIIYKKKGVKVGDIVDLPKARAESYIKRKMAKAYVEEDVKKEVKGKSNK